MALKNFFFMENWVGSEVIDMKIAFFDPTRTHILAPKKTQIWNSLKKILVFNAFERQKLHYYQVCDFITKAD